MDVFLKVFESIAILFGIGLIGFTVISRKIVPIKILDVLSPLILDIALPCLIFTNIISRFDPLNFTDWWTLPIWWIGFTVVTILLSLIAMKLVKKEFGAEFGISLLYPNMIFIPMVIIQNLYGDNSTVLVELFIFVLFFPAFMFNTYHLFFRNSNSGKQKFSWKKFFNPILVATIFAVSMRLTNFDSYVPDVFFSIAKILGNTALPLVLFLIGGNIYVDYKRKGDVKIKPILIFVLVKNFLFPLIVLVLLVIFKPSYSLAFIIFLLSAVPPITTVPILIGKAGGNTAISNQYILSSFIVSIISIPLVMMIFDNYFSLN